MRCLYLCVVLMLSIVLFTDPTLIAQSYTVTDLGTLGGTQSYGLGINQAGDVTGFAYRSCDGCYSHAFLYKNGKMRDLGALSDEAPSEGRGISGGKGEGKIQVTGDSHTQSCVSSDCGPTHAFLYSNHRMLDLGTLPSGTNSEGFAVNSSGEVTGWSDVQDSEHSSMTHHAFLYSQGEMQDLGTLPAGTSSFGTGINNGGSKRRNNEPQVTGYSSTALGFNHAFLYSDGKMEDLGTLPGGSSSAGYAINESGEVAGSSETSTGTSHAFLYSHGHMRDLGAVPDFSYCSGDAINDAGDVVGHCFNMFVTRAFLYKRGRVYDLQSMIPADSGWDLEYATGINNEGQITGIGYHGTTRAFLLTPVTTRSWRETK